MEFDDLLIKRRSIRKYSADGAVDKASIEKMLSAALMAPSWKNSETGRYYVVTDPQKLEAIKISCLPTFNANNAADAPVLIVTGFVKGIAGFGADGAVNEMGDMWGAYDLGLQNQNLILKASDLGYDTLIMGIRDEARLRELLDIPENVQIAAVIALGVRAAEPRTPPRKELAEISIFY